MPTRYRLLTPKRVITASLVVVMWVVLSILLGRPKPGDYSGGWDFQAIWLGPYLLTQGESPFDAETWLGEHERYAFAPKNDTFLYPLPFAILLLPIGLFPLGAAAVIWAAASLAMIALSAYLILKDHVQFTSAYILPILTGVFFFRPVAVLLYILQLDAIILLWVVLGWYLWLHERWFWGGMVMALAVLKPQVGVLILAFLGVWQIFRSRWAAILGEGTTLVGLFVLGLALDPAWVGRWLAIGGDKTVQNFYSTPTLWGLAALACKPSLVCTQWLAAVLSIAIALAILWIILRREKDDLTYVMSTVICGTLFISPYLWSYTQLLLILPLLLITVALYRLKWPYVVVASFPLLATLVSFGLVGISILIGADLISALVPVLVWVALILVDRKDPKLLHTGW